MTFNKPNQIKKEYFQIEDPDQNDEFEREGNEVLFLHFLLFQIHHFDQDPLFGNIPF